MDLTEVIRSIRPIRPEDADYYVSSKLAALKSAFKRVADPIIYDDFNSFVDNLPPALLTTYFGSDGIDQHYTRLLAALVGDLKGIDVVAAMVLNYMLQQLTYQGRYLGRFPLAEAFVAINPHPEQLAMSLANVDRIESLAIGNGREIDPQLTERIVRSSLNYRPAAWGTPEILEKTLAGSQRPIGCLAWNDVGEGNFGIDTYAETAMRLRGFLNADSFYFFSGSTDFILDIQRQLTGIVPEEKIQHKTYSLQQGGSIALRSILLASGFAEPPQLTGLTSQIERYLYLLPQDFAAGKAPDVEKIIVRPPENVPVKLPVRVNSSAPLSNEQIATISKDLRCHHYVFHIPSGKVIHAETVHAQCYVIATARNQVLEQLHYMPLIKGIPHGQPDAEGVSSAAAKPIRFVPGNSLLFSFSPAIVAYHSHFLLQCFTRVVTAEAMDISGMRLLVPSTLRSYQRRMLEMAGWGEERLIVMDPTYTYSCENLYVPNIPPAIFSPFQSTIYDRLISQVEDTSVNPEKRIIISRAARTTWRNMVNYDAVCDILVDELDFEIVEPDKLSIEDEIRLFQSAAIVVGAEGAGMYNCCFMAPNTDVVVMADQDYVMYVVGSMAAIRGFDVSFVFGEAFQTNRDLTRKAGHADFVIDPLRVKAAVEQVIARRRLRKS